MSSQVDLLKPIYDFLACRTPQAWIDVACQNIPLLLQDHANCEKKAAGTAMNLMFRYGAHTELQVKLAQLVREEMLHYEQVIEIMRQHGQVWEAVSASRYALGLRKHIRTHEPAALVDVLIVGAFVEARSCERFAALAPYVEERLAKFYRYLLKSESRHFEDYLTLARTLVEDSERISIDERIVLFREVERELIESTDTEIRFHSGVPLLS
ncbi:tRNA-(ms[2]io[6]A)-hydroxylase [Aquirhabdus sp.]|uniref:tRNA-(ms[2]io[6]A)-hydroxylase n=1 Tax=Aquirhabdus sp. TaxID=2824160 RepID=UPI00396CA6FF